MEYKISQKVEINNRKFEVVDEIGKDESSNKKSLFWSNVLAIVLFIVVAVLGYLAIRWIHPPMCFRITIWSFVILIGGYVAYLFVHELLRGLLLILFGGVSLKDLKYGAVVKQGIVYCISKAPVRLRGVRASLVIPFFLVFAPLFVSGILLGDIVFILGSALAITVSSADFYYMWLLRKQKGNLFLLEDWQGKSREELSGYILKEDISIDTIEKE